MAPITILGRKICLQVVLKRHKLDLTYMEKYSVANILKDIFSPPACNQPAHA